jgi:protein-S-isoprenylcysteine O-methyltransferase Ste14
MWAFWVSFVIFLAQPRQILGWWPLSTVDRIGSAEQATLAEHPGLAALIDLALVALFGVQHSVMARPWFKEHVRNWLPDGLERSTYVHLANAALFVLILCWQPLPLEVWKVDDGPVRDMLWLLFAAGWIILLLGAWSFGMRELLGVEQVRAWTEGRRHAPRLKTSLLYQWLRHPMYVGVLLGLWATPRMSLGHLLLASALTAYVLIAMRYEEKDLLRRFGSRYSSWRGIS